MLILKICDEEEKTKKVKGIFRKKIIYESQEIIKRYSVDINGKDVVVLELSEHKLNSEDALMLLKIYKGRVLVSEEKKDLSVLQQYLFSPKEYYKRAILSSLINQIKCMNNEWKNICIKTELFSYFKELLEVVRISKKVILLTKANSETDRFLNDCYYEYGSVVTVKEENDCIKYDVFLDLDEIDDKGRLMITVKDKNFLMYPDISYFESNVEYQKLLPFSINHNEICAAFSDK